MYQKPKNKWILASLNSKQKDSQELIGFLNQFYASLEERNKFLLPGEEVKTTKSQLYKQSVLNLMEEYKSKFPLAEIELRQLQQKIEDDSMKFDESSIYNAVPNLIQILIQKDKLSAKDYIINKFDDDDDDDIKMLEEFGQYTLEALIIHVLGIVFNTSETESMVCAASLINQLDSSVRIHSRLLKSHSSKNCISNVHMYDKMEKSKTFSFGVFLLQFMEERGLVSSITMESFGSVVKKSRVAIYSLSVILI